MRVFGSAPDAHASMRAWRFEPLPEIRTVRLSCRSVIMIEVVQFSRKKKPGCLRSDVLLLKLPR
jgi:hypothetical protein